MPIDLAVIGGAMLKSAAAAGAGKLVAAAVEQGKRKLFPSDLEKAILAGFNAARAEDVAASPTSHLFVGCQAQEQAECLKRFVEYQTTVDELQKPLLDEGKPDVDCLLMAFEQVGDDLKLNLVKLSLRRWITTFVETYFNQTAAIRFQVAKGRYLEQLAQRVDDVKFVGIAVSGEEEQADLTQIFVMPDVREEKARSAQIIPGSFRRMIRNPFTGEPIRVTNPNIALEFGIEVERQEQLLEEQRSWAMRDRSAPRVPAQQVLNQTKKKAVLLGAPGSGKTMLVSYFALMLCEQGQCDPTSIGFAAGDDWLPVVVRIRDWILQPNMGLLDYLRQYAEESLCAKALPQGFFEHWLDRGRALILLDGLDEVAEEAQRRKVAEQIETFLHQYRDNPAVITSRPAGYRWDFFDLDEFPHYTLEPFDDKQVATFIDHWYDSRLKDDKAKADRRKADLQKAFEKSDRVKMLAKNPLLLTIITLIHRYQAELPRQRHKLYEKAVETLLTSWDSGKEIKLYEVLAYLKQDDLLYVLKKLAYWIHTQGNAGEEDGGTLIDKDELLKQLSQEIKTLKSCKPHEAKQEADRFVDFIQKRTGLLNEQGRDRYAFVHKTFQEYLTAEEIYDRFEEGEDEVILAHIKSHLHDQHWREVLLLLVSRLKKKRAATAIEAILNAGSEYEQWLHRDLLFAGWCLTEDPPELKTAAPDLVGEILDRLIELETTDSVQVGSRVRRIAGNILEQFSETSLQSGVLEKLHLYSESINPVRFLEFQLLLGQESEAIKGFFILLKNGASYFLLGRLADISDELCSAILSFITSGISEEIGDAISSLGSLRNPPKKMLTDLEVYLSHEDPYICAATALTLGRLGYTSHRVVETLLELFKYQRTPDTSDDISSDEKRVKEYTMNSTIVLQGVAAHIPQEIVRNLLDLLNERDHDLRYRVIFVLGQISNPSYEIRSVLLELLQDTEPSIRAVSSESLATLKQADLEVKTAFLELLRDSDSSVRTTAIESLRIFEPVDLEVKTALVALLQDPDALVRAEALESLGRIGHTDSITVAELLAQFHSNLDFIRIRGITSCIHFHKSFPESVVELISLLKDESWNIRENAVESLKKISRNANTVFPELVQWIEQQPEDQAIGSAIDVLWSIVVE
jgi:hypothetical protein